jgi:hypothetical protein
MSRRCNPILPRRIITRATHYPDGELQGIDQYERALRIKPTLPRPCVTWELLWHRGQNPEAIEQLKAARESTPATSMFETIWQNWAVSKQDGKNRSAETVGVTQASARSRLKSPSLLACAARCPPDISGDEAWGMLLQQRATRACPRVERITNRSASLRAPF